MLVMIINIIYYKVVLCYNIDNIKKCRLPRLLKKYYSKPFEHEAKSIVAGPSFMQYLNKLFKTQIAAGDILQFESDNHNRFFMFSWTGTWDEICSLAIFEQTKKLPSILSLHLKII